MVCDSRYELTSKHPGRGRERDAERERGRRKRRERREGGKEREREARGGESAGNKRGQRGEAPNDSGQDELRTRRKVDECVKVRASSQAGVTERSVLVSSPAACVLFAAEYQVFCTEQVQILFFSLHLTFSLTLNLCSHLRGLKQTSHQ